jgi:hypothetical protein
VVQQPDGSFKKQSPLPFTDNPTAATAPIAPTSVVGTADHLAQQHNTSVDQASTLVNVILQAPLAGNTNVHDIADKALAQGVQSSASHKRPHQNEESDTILKQLVRDGVISREEADLMKADLMKLDGHVAKRGRMAEDDDNDDNGIFFGPPPGNSLGTGRITSKLYLGSLASVKGVGNLLADVFWHNIHWGAILVPFTILALIAVLLYVFVRWYYGSTAGFVTLADTAYAPLSAANGPVPIDKNTLGALYGHTISFWINISDWAYKAGTTKYIVQRGVGSNQFSIAIGNDMPQIQLSIPAQRRDSDSAAAEPSASSTYMEQVIVPVHLPLRKWNHIAISANDQKVGNSMDIWVNGRLAATVPILLDEEADQDAGARTVLFGNGGFSGQIMMLQYHSRVMTANQVYASYVRGVAGMSWLDLLFGWLNFQKTK